LVPKKKPVDELPFEYSRGARKIKLAEEESVFSRLVGRKARDKPKVREKGQLNAAIVIGGAES